MFFSKKEARILVVDDDRTLTDNLVEYLSKLRYRTHMRYMSKIELTLTLCRLQLYTLYNPVFCLDNGE